MPFRPPVGESDVAIYTIETTPSSPEMPPRGTLLAERPLDPAPNKLHELWGPPDACYKMTPQPLAEC